LIRKSPTKAFEKESEEVRVMRAPLKRGEWDERRKSLIQKKNVVKKEAELIQ